MIEAEKKKQLLLTKTWVVCGLAMICCALWGSAFPCIKLGYNMMGIEGSDTASQILYAGERFTLAGILTVILGSLTQRKILLPKKKELGHVLVLCMLQTVLQYLFFYVGLAHTSGVKASIIEGMNVFVALLVAALLFHQEKLSLQKLLGCLIGFAGVVLVNMAGSSLNMEISLFGEGFIFFSTVAYAFSSVVMKSFSKTDNPVMLSGYQFVLGGIIMMACGKMAGGEFMEYNAPRFAMLFYLAMISAVAYSLWSILLKYNPVSKVAVFGFMNPVCGVILSAILLKEKDTLGISCLLALILVCLGIYVVNGKDWKKE